VAALMLTFVTAIIAGFFMYGFIFGLTERMKTTFPTEPLKHESAHVNDTCLTVYVSSFASVNIQVVEVYIDEVMHSLSEKVTVAPGAVSMIQLYGTYTKGKTYIVRIVPSVGPSLILEVKYE